MLNNLVLTCQRWRLVTIAKAKFDGKSSLATLEVEEVGF